MPNRSRLQTVPRGIGPRIDGVSEAEHSWSSEKILTADPQRTFGMEQTPYGLRPRVRRGPFVRLVFKEDGLATYGDDIVGDLG